MAADGPIYNRRLSAITRPHGTIYLRRLHKNPMQKKRNNQNSSRPEGYHPAGITIPLRLTKRQEKYA